MSHNNQEQYVSFIHSTIFECLLYARHCTREVTVKKQWLHRADTLEEEGGIDKNDNNMNNSINKNNKKL